MLCADAQTDQFLAVGNVAFFQFSVIVVDD